MGKSIKRCALPLVALLLMACWPGKSSCLPAWESDTLDQWIFESIETFHALHRQYKKLEMPLHERSLEIGAELAEHPLRKARRQYRLLLEKERIGEQLAALEEEKEMQLLKIRYKKGIDLIKLLYEKILALDHHFSGMQIYQNILLLSNPNSYPDFQKSRNLLEDQLKKKNALVLPPILHSNPYMSAAFSLVATFIGDGETKDRQKEFDQISCILDFTVRMSAELSIIQHETEYLKTANQTLKKDCERLFEDYVKVVGYLVPLEKCRFNDDWETVYLQLDDFIRSMESDLTNPASRWSREQVNLEFATQRVADFIGQYQYFVSQGAQYYQKFDNIISTYENEDFCKQNLPRQFDELRKDIRQTIDKFSHTYNLPEIQGSRMKDLLFGVPE
ncbi:MAG: hypothetical protein WA004_06000 [Saprospiraceae bacterium]